MVVWTGKERGGRNGKFGFFLVRTTLAPLRGGGRGGRGTYSDILATFTVSSQFLVASYAAEEETFRNILPKLV